MYTLPWVEYERRLNSTEFYDDVLAWYNDDEVSSLADWLCFKTTSDTCVRSLGKPVTLRYVYEI